MYVYVYPRLLMLKETNIFTFKISFEKSTIFVLKYQKLIRLHKNIFIISFNQQSERLNIC